MAKEKSTVTMATAGAKRIMLPPGWLDSFGKIAGLISSIGFILWAVLVLSFGRVRSWNQAEIEVFFALLILFSGPIAYFWVTTGAEVQMKIAGATLLMGGAYAVAFGIAAFVQQIRPLTPKQVFRIIDLDTESSNPDQVVARVRSSFNGRAWVTSEDMGNSSHNWRAWTVIVRFDEYDPELLVDLSFYNGLGADGKLTMQVERDGASDTPHLVFPVASNTQ
jgi:hypothetical protein